MFTAMWAAATGSFREIAMDWELPEGEISSSPFSVHILGGQGHAACGTSTHHVRRPFCGLAIHGLERNLEEEHGHDLVAVHDILQADDTVHLLGEGAADGQTQAGA